jgi:hypothetical protein
VESQSHTCQVSWQRLELCHQIATIKSIGYLFTSTKQHDPHVKAYFQHLVANGKKPLQAVCAVMRKLLHAIHGMLKNNEPFDNTRFYAIPECNGY